jgi:hypothetical protein
VTTVRVAANGNVLTVVDGDPGGSTEIRRDVAEPLVDLGVLEVIEDEAPAAPPARRRK